MKKEIIPEEVMDTGLDVTSKGRDGGRSVHIPWEWIGHWEKMPGQNPNKDPKPSVHPGPGQIPEIPGFGHSKEILGSMSQGFDIPG